MRQHNLSSRVYEGEWFFVCQPPCNGYLIEYSFHKFDTIASNFLTNSPIHTNQNCHLCGGLLEWAGYGGAMPNTERILRLLQDGHNMAATVIIASYIESSLQNLLWAVLVDNGIESKKSEIFIEKGRLSRDNLINMIKNIGNFNIKDIVFPIRNMVAHGKGFHKEESFYKLEVLSQANDIDKWINHLTKDREISNFMPSESERWLLFMSVWADGFKKYIENL
ncbi:MAG: hypothetical protein LCH85_15890 [Chloroflexi bacterium]|nr:hypothetical protein [Chloroflexota bacterium]